MSPFISYMAQPQLKSQISADITLLKDNSSTPQHGQANSLSQIKKDKQMTLKTNKFKKISKFIQQLITKQQQEEASCIKSDSLKQNNRSFKGQNWQKCLGVIQESQATLQEHLMELFRSDVVIEVILESRMGKNLKLLSEFCKVYGSGKDEITRMGSMADQIL